MTNIAFSAPPTGAAFMRSNGFFRLIAGPVGSGKTTCCLFELMRRSTMQRPAPDGVRYTRWAIVRQTLEQLRSTVLKDIQQWLGAVANYKVSEKTVFFDFQLNDGTWVKSEWILIPMDDPQDQRRLLSSQLTGAWMSEAIEMSVELVVAIQGRCGRYPSAMQGGASWFGVIADTNMPSVGTEWHRKMALEKPDNWEIFIQPGGFDPDAENLDWLLQTPESLRLPLGHPDRRARGLQYYHNLLANGNDDWVDRYVNAKYGADPSGQTVFKGSFKKHHLVRGLEPVRNRNLIICQDFGRNPCALLIQLDEHERLLVLEEVVSTNMSLSTHMTTHLRPVLMDERYFGLPMYFIGDPSGRAQDSVYDIDPFTYLRSQSFMAYPAPSNDLDRRIGAVEQWLMKMYADGPGMQIDEDRCPKLTEALSSRYRYAKRKNDQLTPKPEKLNPWSDLADCLQYGALVCGTGMHFYVAQHMHRHRGNMQSAPIRRRPSAGGWT